MALPGAKSSWTWRAPTICITVGRGKANTYGLGAAGQLALPQVPTRRLSSSQNGVLSWQAMMGTSPDDSIAAIVIDAEHPRVVHATTRSNEDIGCVLYLWHPNREAGVCLVHRGSYGAEPTLCGGV